MKSYVDRIYYPLEPLYKEIRTHKTVTESNPEGVKGVRQLREALQESVESETRIPIAERTDLTRRDKLKI